MRDLFKKTLAGSMIASAALLVAACGGGTETETENLAATNDLATDPLLDAQTNDVTAIDATANGALDADLGATGTTDTGTTTNGAAADSDATLGETDGGDTGGNTVQEDTIGM